jgi:hypothetical protein
MAVWVAAKSRTQQWEKHGTMVCRDKVPCGCFQPEAEIAAVLTA